MRTPRSVKEIRYPLCLALVAVWPAALHGLGLRIPNQDAEAIARGNAFAASADNPSAIYYNPAGITQLEGQNFQMGMHVISVNSRYRNRATGAETKSKYEMQPVPQFYYTLSPTNSSVSYGVGMYAPYGLGIEWPENSPLRTLSIEGRLMYVTLNPVVAWQIHPTFSLAAGPTVNYAQVKLRQGVAVAGDEFKFKGDDTDFGFSLGARWQPHPKLAFGVSYHSPTTINFGGKSAFIPAPPTPEKAHAKTDFPQFIIGGISYRPTEKWNMEFNIDWTDWDTVDALTFQSATPLPPFQLNWRGSFLYEIGATRYLAGGYFVSAGYFLSENSVPDRNFNPVVPDTTLHVISFGGGHKGEHWNWALVGQLITGPWRTVSGNVAGGPVTADGEYRFFNYALTSSVGYHF
ncbi:MAG: outer membrane protein transport protein [Chloroflexi bacterium]|nr:outer membrane protein transport protein [Chloroflexota bacterium]